MAAAEGAGVRVIPVYVINLARSPERRAFMAEGLARAGVTPQFVAAVDGRDCRSKRPPPRGLSIGEAALVLSHRKAWRRFLAGNAAFAVVLEDDVHLGQDFAALLGADWRAPPFDAVKLETMFDPVWMERRGRPFQGRELRRLGAEHLGSAGYLVSRAGAAKMLKLTRALDAPIDQALFGRAAIFEGRLVVHQLFPAVVVQDYLAPDADARREIASTLHDGRDRLGEARRRARPRGMARLAREAARLWGQARRAIRLAPTMGRVRTPWR